MNVVTQSTQGYFDQTGWEVNGKTFVHRYQAEAHAKRCDLWSKHLESIEKMNSSAHRDPSFRDDYIPPPLQTYEQFKEQQAEQRRTLEFTLEFSRRTSEDAKKRELERIRKRKLRVKTYGRFLGVIMDVLCNKIKALENYGCNKEHR